MDAPPENHRDQISRANVADMDEVHSAEDVGEGEQREENEVDEMNDEEEEAEGGDDVREVENEVKKDGSSEDDLIDDTEQIRIAKLVIDEKDGEENDLNVRTPSLNKGVMRAEDGPDNQEDQQGSDKQAAADQVATNTSREEAGGVSLEPPQDHGSNNSRGDELRETSNDEEVKANVGVGSNAEDAEAQVVRGNGKDGGASGTVLAITSEKVATVDEGGIEARPGQEKHQDENEGGDNEDEEAHDDMPEISSGASRSKMTDQGKTHHTRSNYELPELGEADAADAMDEYEVQAALRAFSSSRPRIPVKVNKAAGSSKAAGSNDAASSSSHRSSSSSGGTGSGAKKGPGALLSGMNRARLKDLIEAQQRGGGPVPNKDRDGDTTRSKRPSNGGVLHLVSSSGSSGKGSGRASPGSSRTSGRQGDQHSRQQRPGRKGNELPDDGDGEDVDEEAARKAKNKYLYQVWACPLSPRLLPYIHPSTP